MRLLSLFVCALLFAAPQPNKQPSAQKQITKDQVQPSKITQEHADSGSAPIAQFYTYNAKQENGSETAKIIFDSLLVLFTLGLVLVGYRQAKILSRQADILGKHEEWMQKHDANLEKLANSARDNAAATITAADVAQKTLVSSFRPKIIVRSLSLRIPFRIRYVFVNQGGTRAHIAASNITVDNITRFQTLPIVPPFNSNQDFLGQRTLEPGDFIEGVINLDPAGIKDIRDSYDRKKSNFSNPGSDVHFFGYVQYRDDNGVVRYVAFCRRFDVLTERFIPVEDSEYEYAD